MITFEEAKAIAKKANKRVNACNEYKEAYHFFENTDEDTDGDNGVVVMKENGHTKQFVQFLLDNSPEQHPHRISMGLKVRA